MQSVIQMATAILAGVGQVVGIRNSIEDPHYRVETKLGDIEIRRYDERLAAETEVEGEAEAARAAGFRRIAGYIFGGNAPKGSIAMTAPAAQPSEHKPQENAQQIAMTAPVAQVKDTDSRWRIQFFMPASYTRDSLPNSQRSIGAHHRRPCPALCGAALQRRPQRQGRRGPTGALIGRVAVDPLAPQRGARCLVL